METRGPLPHGVALDFTVGRTGDQTVKPIRTIIALLALAIAGATTTANDQDPLPYE